MSGQTSNDNSNRATTSAKQQASTGSDHLQHQQDQINQLLFKVLIVGDTSTGKTSFVKRYVHQFFSKAYMATIGIDFAIKSIRYDANTEIRLQIWDIAGQERFGTMTRLFYRDAVGAFLVFDVDKPKTFESVLKWKDDLDSKVSLSDGSNIPCILLANKCDLIHENEIDEEILSNFAAQHGFIGYIYTSPKLNIGIEEAANTLIKEILKKQASLSHDDDDVDKNGRILLRNHQRHDRHRSNYRASQSRDKNKCC